MKLWPPPAGPKEQGPEREEAPRDVSQEGNQPLRSSSRPADQPGLHRVLSHPEPANTAAVVSPPPPGHLQLQLIMLTHNIYTPAPAFISLTLRYQRHRMLVLFK